MKHHEDENLYTEYLLDTYKKTKLIFESDIFQQLASLAINEEIEKILVFTGKNSADKSGAWKRLLNAFSRINCDIVRYSEIMPEPDIQCLEDMSGKIKKEKPDFIIAVGGGSVMDAAKAANLIEQSGKDIHNLFGTDEFSEKNSEKLKKVICIPTSAGTGSEVTPYSNIVDRKIQVKKLINEKQIIPEYSFLDPELTVSMPETVTKATAFDALSHSIEGFLNVHEDKNDKLANKRAMQGIKLIVENLPELLKNPKNTNLRKNLSYASCLAGMVITEKSTGLPHLCSFSWFGKIEHGIAVAVLLPYAWKYYLNNPEVAERTMELAPIFCPNAEKAEDIVHSYAKFAEKCGVSMQLSKYKGINMELLEQSAESGKENTMKLKKSPKPVPVEESSSILRKILTNAWNGTL